MAYQAKTAKNKASVAQFLNGIEDAGRRRDAKTVLKMMKKVTGEKPQMWGSSIVGFGEYAYTYKSGHSGRWMRLGFSPRKQSLTLYIMNGFSAYKDLLKKLGPYATGKSCLYIKDLDLIHLPTLTTLMRRSYKAMADPKTC